MTKTTSIPFSETGYFSNLICDYLDQKESVRDYYNHFSNIEGFRKQIEDRFTYNDSLDRTVLVNSLKKQYQDIKASSLTKKNIEALNANNTFTITTGHQLNLFTGPLYFLYKIISTINLTKELKKEFPDCNFVPLYWMATEDHDFEEIQFFNFKGNEICWRKDTSGAVGRLNTSGLQDVYDEFERLLGKGKNAQFIKELFKKSYLEHDNLANATRFLANEVFSEQGLVVLDADEKDLKKGFSAQIKQELIGQNCFKVVSKTITTLGKQYKIQVNPREINLFYLDTNLRERIIYEAGIYKINNTDITFSQEEILKEVENNPERFSPNVLMRPLYQEVILPNLCYIGGGGELAYWLQLKSYFKDVGVSYPILLLRNSALLYTEKQAKKLKKLNVSMENLFLKQKALIDDKVRDISEIEIDLSTQRAILNNMFKELESLSNQTDPSFLGAVNAQQKKQLNGLDKLEKRLLKAQKRKYQEIMQRISSLQNELFPNQSLQERQLNFSEFYDLYGQELNKVLFSNLQPLKLQFDLIEV